MTRAGLGSLLLLLLAAPPVGAQDAGLSLEAGTGTTGWEGEPSTGVVSLTPGGWWENAWSRLQAQAVYSSRVDQGWAVDGGASGSILLPRVGPLRPELSALAEWTGYQYFRGSQLTQGEGRVYLGRGERGVWIGGALGRARTPRSATGLVRLQGGTWRRIGPVDVRLSVGRTSFPDSVPRATIVFDSTRGRADTLARHFLSSYTDLRAALAWRLGRADLEVGLSQRLGKREFVATDWYASGTLHLAGLTDVVAAMGRYPAELASGRPGGRYATLSLRLRMPVARSARGYGSPPPATAPSAFRLRRLEGGGYRLAIEVSGASSVEVMGDFSDWQPVRLVPEGSGRWTVVLHLTPGLHRINVRVDGGTWTVPPGTTPVADEFAGRVGVFVVD